MDTSEWSTGKPGSTTHLSHPTVQVEAAKKLGEFFPNREGINIDLAEEPEPEEDETAGNLGLPFTEPPPGEEEEWVD